MGGLRLQVLLGGNTNVSWAFLSVAGLLVNRKNSWFWRRSGLYTELGALLSGSLCPATPFFKELWLPQALSSYSSGWSSLGAICKFKLSLVPALLKVKAVVILPVSVIPS